MNLKSWYLTAALGCLALVGVGLGVARGQGGPTFCYATVPTAGNAGIMGQPTNGGAGTTGCQFSFTSTANFSCGNGGFSACQICVFSTYKKYPGAANPVSQTPSVTQTGACNTGYFPSITTTITGLDCTQKYLVEQYSMSTDPANPNCSLTNPGKQKIGQMIVTPGEVPADPVGQ